MLLSTHRLYVRRSLVATVVISTFLSLVVCVAVGAPVVPLTGDRSLPEEFQTIEEMPRSEFDIAAFTPMTPRAALRSYQLLKDVDTLFEKHRIEYWACGGTLLGAVRHQGMIPWDDDTDIQIWSKDVPKFMALKDELSSLGYSMYPIGYGQKIFYTNGAPIRTTYDLEGNWRVPTAPHTLSFKYPFLDVFFSERQGSKVIFSSEKAKGAWSKSYFDIDGFYPLQRVKFGSTSISIPGGQSTLKLLDRSMPYWDHFGIAGWKHQVYVNRGTSKVPLRYLPTGPARPTGPLADRVRT